MELYNASFSEFSDYVKKNRLKVVLFGAGAIGKVLIPYMAEKYGIEENIVCYVDNNPAKWNTQVGFSQKKVNIYSPAILENPQMEDFVIMITNGDFSPVLTQLQENGHLKNKLVFLAPIMQLNEKKENKKNKNSGLEMGNKEPMIPKVIHYCWFSGKPIPENLKKCIESWRKRCPDYEIIRWDETNYDVGRYAYTRQAYEAQKWGFIPDIARLEILYEYGGFYLDTDVELLKSLDSLRCQKGFCGREEWGHVNFGGGSGCVKHFDTVGELLDFRKNVPFLLPDGYYNTEASGYFETKPLLMKGFSPGNVTETIDDFTVYASDFFHPFNYITGRENITENTISIHYFSGGWLGEEGKRYRQETREKFAAVESSLPELSDTTRKGTSLWRQQT